MKHSTKILLAAIAAMGLCARANAQTSATGVVNLVSINGSGSNQTFSYNLVVKDTGSTSIDSFWYAWVPYIGSLPDNYYNFLPHSPTAETSPTGWTPTVVGPGIFGGGYSIRWDAGSNDLAPGSTDTFGFTSPDNFATITGTDTVGFIPDPVGTSYIYTGLAEASASSLVTVAAGTSTVPEPATFALMAIAAGSLFVRRPRRLGFASSDG